MGWFDIVCNIQDEANSRAVWYSKRLLLTWVIASLLILVPFAFVHPVLLIPGVILVLLISGTIKNIGYREGIVFSVAKILGTISTSSLNNPPHKNQNQPEESGDLPGSSSGHNTLVDSHQSNTPINVVINIDKQTAWITPILVALAPYIAKWLAESIALLTH